MYKCLSSHIEMKTEKSTLCKDSKKGIKGNTGFRGRLNSNIPRQQPHYICWLVTWNTQATTQIVLKKYLAFWHALARKTLLFTNDRSEPSQNTKLGIKITSKFSQESLTSAHLCVMWLKELDISTVSCNFVDAKFNHFSDRLLNERSGFASAVLGSPLSPIFSFRRRRRPYSSWTTLNQEVVVGAIGR